jgi:hypothetical protein
MSSQKKKKNGSVAGKKTYMESKILSGPNCLTHKDPSLGKTVDGAEETGEKNKALYMCDLGICVADILQDKRTDEV